MHIARGVSLMMAAVFALFFCLSTAHAIEYPTRVDSAPLEYRSDATNGVVRVYLSSMGTITALDVTVAGSYTADGAVKIALSANETVHVEMNAATGEITMTCGGYRYAMGRDVTLKRHMMSGTNGLTIAQSRKPGNLYPGDLQLIAQLSGGQYKLYPILHVYMEAYLNGVVPFEMSDASNIEALKAQAVAARTYTLRKMNARTSQIYDVVDTTSDQVYYGNSDQSTNCIAAVAATKGIVLMNDGKLTGTYYSASNGGQTESVRNIWGSTSMDYLSVKDDPFDLMSSAIRRTVTVYADNQHANQNPQLKALLQSKAQSVLASMGHGTSNVTVTRIHSITPHTPKYAAPSRLYTKLDFAVTASTPSGNIPLTLTFDIFGELEGPLGMSINATANELWSVETFAEEFTLYARRHGHGVGMSQRGAVKMGVLGYTYDQILGFYYEGCQRVQYTFTHTILPPVGSASQEPIVITESPADLPTNEGVYATVQLSAQETALPIRYTAESGGTVLTLVPNGSILSVLAKSHSWCLVQYGAIVGYAPADKLSITSSVPDNSPMQPTQLSGWAVVTSTNGLNLRESASYTARVITEMPKDTILCVLSIQKPWAHVQYGMKTGYASTDYLKLHDRYPGDVTTEEQTATVEVPSGVGGVNMRQKASTSSGIVAVVPHGETVRILSDEGSWCRVAYGQYEGYVLAAYLRFHQGSGGDTPSDPEKPGDPQEQTAIVQTSSGSLNLRQSPSKKAAVLTTIPRGASVTVQERASDWCAVRYAGLSGYVMTQYLRFDQTGATPAPPETPVVSYAIVNTQKGSLNLRKQPKTGSTVLTTLPKGARVSVLAWDTSWSHVSYGGYTGYAMTTYLLREGQSGSESGGTQQPTQPPVPTPLPPVSATVTATVNTASGSLNLRQAATTSSTVLTRIPQASTVEVLSRDNTWSHVRYGGVTGYVMTRYLQFHQALVSTSGGSLNLRTAASSSASVLMTIPNGKTVTLLAEGTTWSWVQYQDVAGYVMTKYLRIGQTGE